MDTSALKEPVFQEVISIRQLYLSIGHNFFGHHGQPAGQNLIFERPYLECIAGRGICGDRFFDHQENYKGQISFFAWETYQEICNQLSVWDRSSAVFRRNVITSGIDLNALIGREFSIQGVHFYGTEECRPCYWMDQAFAPGACAFLEGKGGLRAEILSSGFLCANVP